MRAFAELLDQLAFTPQRNGKLRLIGDHVGSVPDPDRGWALAALTGALDLRTAKPALVRALASERTDPALFALSYDYVGDLAETVALIWPECDARPNGLPSLTEVVTRLSDAGRGAAPALLAELLDRAGPIERWALLKLATGGLRVGVSARLAKTALAERFGINLAEIEEVWHGLEPPYAALFAWLEGRAPRPDTADGAGFRPLMLASPLDDAEIEALPLDLYAAEWKWDGIRVQCVARGGERRLYSRTGDDIGRAFPDVLAQMDFDAVLDGELLIARGDGPPYGDPAPFNALQQRLNRKTVTAKMLREAPAFVRLYDMLYDGTDDLRPLPFAERRARLEAWYGRAPRSRFDLSPLVPFRAFADLSAVRDGARAEGIEGLMLKRRDAAYVAGRPKGPWVKWKRSPLTLDLVLMYAQRGHGKRASLYSDYTFGAWRPRSDGAGEELVPVGKAYSGYTDRELDRLDRWIRANTIDRFGPVRVVAPGLVLEIAFDSVHRSTRHKSGVAMRFPRVARIRWDKPADEAERLEMLERLVVE